MIERREDLYGQHEGPPPSSPRRCVRECNRRASGRGAGCPAAARFSSFGSGFVIEAEQRTVCRFARPANSSTTLARAFPGNSCAKGISAFPFASALQVSFRNKRISACPFASALQVSFCVRRNPLAGSPFERNVKKVCRRPRNLSFCFTRHTNCSAYVLCEVGIGISGCKRDGATRVRPRRRWPAHPRLAQDAAEPIGTRWHGRMVDGWSSDHMPPV